MGNVTQVLPGIHPVVGVDAGRRVAASAGVRRGRGVRRARDDAVIDGAIMLARTVVRLAETPAERDRVISAGRRVAS